jgi:Fe-S-cluster containining protein
MTYPALLTTLDSWFARGIADAGPGIVPCREGCTACCHGPFDISPADARLVAAAVDALPREVAEGVRARAAAQRGLYAKLVPGWRAPWEVAALSEEGFDALADALAHEPCPALDPVRGSCLIHASRPATCRLTGLGLVTLEGDVLENVCPIQAEHPAYAALAPTPFDLLRFEDAAEGEDQLAGEAGWVATTVAGAVG